MKVSGGGPTGTGTVIRGRAATIADGAGPPAWVAPAVRFSAQHSPEAWHYVKPRP